MDERTISEIIKLINYELQEYTEREKKKLLNKIGDIYERGKCKCGAFPRIDVIMALNDFGVYAEHFRLRCPACGLSAEAETVTEVILAWHYAKNGINKKGEAIC